MSQPKQSFYYNGYCYTMAAVIISHFPMINVGVDKSSYLNYANSNANEIINFVVTDY